MQAKSKIWVFSESNYCLCYVLCVCKFPVFLQGDVFMNGVDSFNPSKQDPNVDDTISALDVSKEQVQALA